MKIVLALVLGIIIFIPALGESMSRYQLAFEEMCNFGADKIEFSISLKLEHPAIDEQFNVSNPIPGVTDKTFNSNELYIVKCEVEKKLCSVVVFRELKGIVRKRSHFILRLNTDKTGRVLLQSMNGKATMFRISKKKNTIARLGDDVKGEVSKVCPNI